MKQEIQNFADSHETSIEIANAIFKCSDHTERSACENWEDPTDKEQQYVVELAFSQTEETELFWGEETIINCAKETVFYQTSNKSWIAKRGKIIIGCINYLGPTYISTFSLNGKDYNDPDVIQDSIEMLSVDDAQRLLMYIRCDS